MNRLLFSVILTLVFFSACKKNLPDKEATYLEQVKTGLKATLPQVQWQQVDDSRARRSPSDSTGKVLLRMPFKGKTFSEGFVLLETDPGGSIRRGRVIQLQKEQSNSTPYRYQGAITIRALDGTILTQSAIKNGYILAFHEQPSAQKTTSLMPPEYEELPEVVVVASYSYDVGYTYTDWFRLECLLDLSGGGSDYYYWGDGYGGGGSYGDGGTTGGSGSVDGIYGDGGLVLDSPILIDYETDVYKNGIDVYSYLKCFDAIPDVGSSCSIEIFADIPVDDDPNKLFNWDTESPGHTFIQVKKSNGFQSAVQNIGFYPNTQWKTLLTTAPIQGKFVDNGEHEFNASFKMNVSPENFRSILTEIQYLAGFIQYDIDEYNCTDFALDVFNKVRTDKLMIPMYTIPGGTAAGGTRTPQGLYNQLKVWKEAGHMESANINIPGHKGWVALSTGSCN